MTTRFNTNASNTVKAWLDKVENVKFNYYYRPKKQ